jgi:hypothetical protein
MQNYAANTLCNSLSQLNQKPWRYNKYEFESLNILCINLGCNENVPLGFPVNIFGHLVEFK